MDVQEYAFRLDHCSLDLHPLKEGNKEVSKDKRVLINSFIDGFIVRASTSIRRWFIYIGQSKFSFG